jgi:cobaltochelatase CobN
MPLTTTRACHAQLLVCALGCCCGRTDKGKPAVPVDWLKAEWRRRRLNPRVQLTMTGCLGPCDLVNVVGLITADGPVWLGGLQSAEHFQVLLDWAASVHDARHALPLPAALEAHCIPRFPAPRDAACPATTPDAA